MIAAAAGAITKHQVALMKGLCDIGVGRRRSTISLGRQRIVNHVNRIIRSDRQRQPAVMVEVILVMHLDHGSVLPAVGMRCPIAIGLAEWHRQLHLAHLLERHRPAVDEDLQAMAVGLGQRAKVATLLA